MAFQPKKDTLGYARANHLVRSIREGQVMWLCTVPGNRSVREYHGGGASQA